MSKAFEPAAFRVSPDEFDQAILLALYTLAGQLAQNLGAVDPRFIEDSDIFAYVLTGYRVGRTLLDTHSFRLEYSTPDAVTQNAEKVLDRRQSLNMNEALEHAGPTALRFIIESVTGSQSQSQSGVFAEIGLEDPVKVGSFAAANGLTLAIAEDELFVGHQGAPEREIHWSRTEAIGPNTGVGSSKKLPSSMELWLMSLRSAALVEDSDLGCRFVWPPGGGIVAGAMCGMQGDPHPHEYFGPGSIKSE